MTISNEALQAIQTRFIEQYTGIPAGRVIFQNEDEIFTAGSIEPWIRLSVLDLIRVQETLGKKGNRKYRPRAQVVVQIYTQTNIGVQLGDDLAEEALDIYEGESFESIDFNNGITRRSGVDGRWYIHIVEVDFDYEDIK